MSSTIKVNNIQNLAGDDSGFDLSTNDQVDIKTANTTRVRVDSSGNVGIGTNAPTMPLDVICADNKNIVSREGAPNITNGFEIVSNDSSNQAQFVANSATGEVNIGAINTNFFLTFSTNGTNERMRIDSSGNALVGTSSTTPNPGISLQPNGNIGIGNSSGNSGVSFLEFRRSATQIGGVTQSGTTGVAFNTSSDYRLKENVNYDFDATSRLKQLKPSRFNFKTDKDTTVDGFLAHEVQSIVPEAITGTKDAVDEDGNPEYQGIDQSKLVPLLTKALQEAVAKIETLEAKVTALEGK